jgi:hypothetical protein
MFIAKPSIEHYLVKTEKLDPITAIEALEKHPPVPSKMIEFPDTEITLRYKDPKALELLSYLEYDVVEARKIYTERWGFKMYNLMINRVSRILRGARVMFLDKEGTLIFTRIESSRACSQHIAKTLATYPYVTNIYLTDEDNLIAAFVMPFKYWNNIMTWLIDLCSSRTIRFKTYITVLSGGLIRQYIPWRNYNIDTHYWGFDEVAKLELVRLVRRAKSAKEAFKLYEWDVNEYTRRLIETMGVDYVVNLLPQLPLDVRRAVIDALNSLLQGGRSGGGGGGNP